MPINASPTMLKWAVRWSADTLAAAIEQHSRSTLQLEGEAAKLTAQAAQARVNLSALQQLLQRKQPAAPELTVAIRSDEAQQPVEGHHVD